MLQAMREANPSEAQVLGVSEGQGGGPVEDREGKSLGGPPVRDVCGAQRLCSGESYLVGGSHAHPQTCRHWTRKPVEHPLGCVEDEGKAAAFQAGHAGSWRSPGHWAAGRPHELFTLSLHPGAEGSEGHQRAWAGATQGVGGVDQYPPTHQGACTIRQHQGCDGTPGPSVPPSTKERCRRRH